MPIETTIKEGQVMAPLSALSNWSKNPRGIKEDDFRRLIKQLQKHGLNKPLLVDASTGEVLGGNMRFRALKQIGATEVWVSLVHPKNETEQIEIALADNDNAGYYEEDRLAELVMPHREKLDLKIYKVDFGKPISIGVILDRYGPTEEDDFDIEAELENIDEPISKPGEVYDLGPHKLLCGDCSDERAMSTFMGKKMADMVFTDPPYGVSYQTGLSKEEARKLHRRTDGKEVINDNFDLEDIRKLIGDALKVAPLKKGGTFYFCSPAGDMETEFRLAISDAEYLLKQCIVWQKQHFVMGRQDYQWQHESILYGWKAGSSHQFYGGHKQGTIWEVDCPRVSRAHPTMKPIALISKAIRNSTEKGQTILDMFGGSGSTIIASEQTGRICYMVEIDPIYCDVIRKRYLQYESNTKGKESDTK